MPDTQPDLAASKLGESSHSGAERIYFEMAPHGIFLVDSSARIVDSRRKALPLSDSVERLLLVTCYPFDALAPGGPLRYVVSAVPLSTETKLQPHLL